MSFTFIESAHQFAVHRLPAGTPLPASLINLPADQFATVTRTTTEVSILAPTTVDVLAYLADADRATAASHHKVQQPFAAFKIDAQLDFSLVGILAGITTALKSVGVSVFVVSTYDTDFVLVPADKRSVAVEALVGQGHTIVVGAL
ncbi:ACT domain-containing protein [Blastocladiella britannica]|nr:ACT domain-containing protein [Blastocladiella britannica]